ncbi:MAG: sigma 54-interacting transcriptional regulator [Myxococcota bacterium]
MATSPERSRELPPEGRAGLLAEAHGGTLFLDEVAELPLDLQAVLLGFLEDGRYHRVGEAVMRTSDVRLVAAR